MFCFCRIVEGKENKRYFFGLIFLFMIKRFDVLSIMFLWNVDYLELGFILFNNEICIIVSNVIRCS